jgi:hypothetical protein
LAAGQKEFVVPTLKMAGHMSIGVPFSTLEQALGHLRGKVVACDNKVIIGCKIRIRETDQTVYSDNNGNFIMINIAPGLYSITAECTGYSPCIFSDASIYAGDNPGFRFVMHPNC